MAWGYALLAIATVYLLYRWYRSGDNRYRLQAVKRVILGIPFLVLMFLAGAVFGTYVVLVFLLDVAWQFLTGRPGFQGDGYAERLWDWKDRNTRWVITGDETPKVWP